MNSVVKVLKVVNCSFVNVLKNEFVQRGLES